MNAKTGDPSGFIPFTDWLLAERARLEEMMPAWTTSDEAAWLRFRMRLLGEHNQDWSTQ